MMVQQQRQWWQRGQCLLSLPQLVGIAWVAQELLTGSRAPVVTLVTTARVLVWHRPCRTHRGLHPTSSSSGNSGNSSRLDGRQVQLLGAATLAMTPAVMSQVRQLVSQLQGQARGLP
jgi:hypothetical protein